ncbi:MAG TPA: chromate resistance protein ChrB domain-containing protein, partial [Stellaceae bacterium]|nr:chromate resistance protein ChrB domain-containing protein [Stellaceae bacterium]
MDDWGRFSLPPQALYSRLGSTFAPIIIDIRETPAFDADEAMIVGAVRRDPYDIDAWRHELPRGRLMVLYGSEGDMASPDAAALLRASGLEACWLEGGIAGWAALGLPQRRKLSFGSGKWVTRARPKIDRIACPWLIRRFVDPTAVFLFVASPEVEAVAERFNGA